MASEDGCLIGRREAQARNVSGSPRIDASHCPDPGFREF
jgi:hypothetical protein